MTMHNFSTEIDPALFVEIEDPDNPGQRIRPGAGAPVLVRNALTAVALDSTVTRDGGYLTIETEDVPAVEVSAAPDVWIGPFWSKQATELSMNAGINAADALATAQEALLAAQNAVTIAGTGGGSGGGSGPEMIVEVAGSPGTYPAPVTSGPRWFFGTLEPTESQGFRDVVPYGDMYWPVVVTS